MVDQQRQSSLKTILVAACSAGWILGFTFWFYASDLPNNSPSPDQVLYRADVWRLAFVEPFPLLNPFDYTNPQAKSGWQYLPQRWPMVQVASVLLLMCFVVGAAVCKSLKLRLRLLWSERVVLIFGVGISLQSVWILLCGLAGQLTTWILVLPSVFSLLVLLLLRNNLKQNSFDDERQLNRSSWKTVLGFCFLMAPFVLHLLLGSMTPSTDFDVREYHLQGPKEWFQQGRITTLEHNVYTSFPFLSEMLSLGAMTLTGEWWTGALAGKLTLTVFPIMSVVCAYALGTRYFGQTCGFVAALLTLSVPWVTRISIIAYAEGAMMFYVTASLLVVLLVVNSGDQHDMSCLCFLAGILSGSAMASKYTGLVTAVVPAALLLLLSVLQQRQQKRVLRLGAVFVLGTIVAMGPWLTKNAVANGNPVYPLGYRVFGADDWNSNLDARWQKAHQPSEHNLSRIPIHLNDFAVRNDWQSGLLFAFAIPALLLWRRDKAIRWVWGYLTWLVVTWWALTHRIDRFWVPLIPIAAVAGASIWNLTQRAEWKFLLMAVMSATCVYNFAFVRSPLIGFHGGLTDMVELKQQPIRSDIAFLNQNLPPDAVVLMVGEAEVFDAEFSLLYNTVFDDNVFQFFTAENPLDLNPNQSLAKSDVIRKRLKEAKVTHVYVNWSEILRYRAPSSYGYCEYITPERFQKLLDRQVLSLPLQPLTHVLSEVPIDQLSPADLKEIQSWPGSQLKSGLWQNRLLYSVRD